MVGIFPSFNTRKVILIRQHLNRVMNSICLRAGMVAAITESELDALG